MLSFPPLSSSYACVDFGDNHNLPTIAMITTGGTIAQKPDPNTGELIPFMSGSELIVNNPLLLKIANIKLIEFSNIDSSKMYPELWVQLSVVVNNFLQDEKIHGVVITHGTDTMPESAYFLDLTTNSEKPIVFTGTMRNSFALSFDGPANLYNSVLQASSKQSLNWGVTINLNQYIHSARYVSKTHTTNMQTFSSGVRGCLGYIENDEVLRFHDRSHKLYLPMPEKLAEVALVKTYVGDDGRILRAAADFGVAGIVVEGFGAGNVNQAIYEEITNLLAKHLPIVITSQVYEGGVYPFYGDTGGGAMLYKLKTIFGGDLPGNKARILLMLLLPHIGNDYQQLCEYFAQC
jgi:L-asparaginase